MTTYVTVNDITPKIQYSATAGQTVFTFPFIAFADTDLKVYVNDVLKTITTDYTVDNDYPLEGGEITFTSGLTLDDIVTIVRDTPLDKVTGWVTGGDFKATTLDDQNARFVAGLQQVDANIGRTARLSDTTQVADGAFIIPEPEDGKALKWDGTTGTMVNSDNDPDEMVTLATAQAVAAAVSASAASGSATTASNWAIKIDASVSGGEFSAKAHAIGATGLTTGAAKDWATKAEDSEVVTGQYSALHWAAKSEGFAEDASDSADAAAASLSAAGLPDPAVSDTYLKRNAGNTAYDAKTAANVLSDIMGGTTASATDIVLGKRTTNPNQPAFYATKSTVQSSVTGDGTEVVVTFDNVINNIGSCYNSSTGEFTAPVAGFYAFSGAVGVSGLTSSHTGANISLVTSNRTHVLQSLNPYGVQYSVSGSTFLSLNFFACAYLDAGDTAYIKAQVSGGTKVVNLSAGIFNRFLSGYLVA